MRPNPVNDLKGLRGLIVSYPKPPVRAEVVERVAGVETRRARVLHDGRDLWFIDDGARIEVNAGAAALLAEGDQIESFVDGILCANNWVKPLLQGRRIVYLDSPSTEASLLGRETVLGYDCYVADVEGLKRDEDPIFRLWVESAFGYILRIARADKDLVLELESVVLGDEQGIAL